MSRRKTDKDYEELISKQEQRIKKLKKQRAEAQKEHEGKVNAEIIKAIKEWQYSLPTDKRTPWDDLPAMYRKEAQKNRDKYTKITDDPT